MKTASQSELPLSSESEKGASAQSLGARCRVITNLAPACAQMLGRAAACLPPPERSSEAGASVSHACPTNWPAQLSVCCACLVGAMTGRSALCGSFRRRVRQAFVSNRPRRSGARYRALGRCRCNFRAAQRGREATCGQAQHAAFWSLRGGHPASRGRVLQRHCSGTVPSILTVGSMRKFGCAHACRHVLVALVITSGPNCVSAPRRRHVGEVSAIALHAA